MSKLADLKDALFNAVCGCRSIVIESAPELSHMPYAIPPDGPIRHAQPTRWRVELIVDDPKAFAEALMATRKPKRKQP